jgi:hypothetical protein
MIRHGRKVATTPEIDAVAGPGGGAAPLPPSFN